MSAADSCWVLTPSERAAAANAGDDVSAPPAANSGCSAAPARAALTCSAWATAAVIASWPGCSSADLAPADLAPAVFVPPSRRTANPIRRSYRGALDRRDTLWRREPGRLTHPSLSAVG